MKIGRGLRLRAVAARVVVAEQLPAPMHLNEDNMAKTFIGTVKMCRDSWGFIEVQHVGDFFFHRDNLAGGLVQVRPGDKVAFEEGSGKHGRTCAVNIRLHEAPPTAARTPRFGDPVDA